MCVYVVDLSDLLFLFKCLRKLCSMDGWGVTTIEGIGNKYDKANLSSCFHQSDLLLDAKDTAASSPSLRVRMEPSVATVVLGL